MFFYHWQAIELKSKQKELEEITIFRTEASKSN